MNISWPSLGKIAIVVTLIQGVRMAYAFSKTAIFILGPYGKLMMTSMKKNSKLKKTINIVFPLFLLLFMMWKLHVDLHSPLPVTRDSVFDLIVDVLGMIVFLIILMGYASWYWAEAKLRKDQN